MNDIHEASNLALDATVARIAIRNRLTQVLSSALVDEIEALVVDYGRKRKALGVAEGRTVERSNQALDRMLQP